VEVLAVLSSRHNVQFRLARSASETEAKSRAVCSSSSAGMGAADSSGKFARIVVTGTSSIDDAEGSPDAALLTFSEELDEEISALAVEVCCNDRSRETRRCNSLKPTSTPSNEYDGGRTLGFSGMDEMKPTPSSLLARS